MSVITPLRDQPLQQRLDAALAQVNQVLLGKPRQVKLAFTCLIAGGHLLLEDVPGVGKTTLAHALAATLLAGIPARTVHQRPAPIGHHRGQRI